MSFIYPKTFHWIGGVRVLKLVHLFLWRVPEPGIVDRRYVEILRHTSYPSRQPVDALAGGHSHRDFDHGVMRNCASAVDRGYVTLPHSKGVLGHWIRLMRPAIWT